jgi:hypothetical protein
MRLNERTEAVILTREEYNAVKQTEDLFKEIEMKMSNKEVKQAFKEMKEAVRELWYYLD